MFICGGDAETIFNACDETPTSPLPTKLKIPKNASKGIWLLNKVLWNSRKRYGCAIILQSTVYPRSLDPFYLVTYYIKWDKSSAVNNYQLQPHQ